MERISVICETVGELSFNSIPPSLMTQVIRCEMASRISSRKFYRCEKIQRRSVQKQNIALQKRKGHRGQKVTYKILLLL